jgi:putative membrane protein (TIGR04086 family)
MERRGKILLIGKGVLLGYLFMILEIFVYSILLACTSIPESSIGISVFVFSLLSVFISSSLVCIKIKENGMKNGGIVGFFYIMLVYLFGSILMGNFALTSKTITTIIFNILLGMIGGIVGVNLASK